jgi:hypothetical protein
MHRLRVNPNWDGGLFVVEEADVPHLLGPDSLQAYLDAAERHIAAVDAAIEEHGEKAALEALRRRHVLVEE